MRVFLLFFLAVFTGSVFSDPVKLLDYFSVTPPENFPAKIQYSSVFGAQSILVVYQQQLPAVFISATPYEGFGNSAGPWENLEANIRRKSSLQRYDVIAEGRFALDAGGSAEYKAYDYVVSSVRHKQLFFLVTKKTKKIWVTATADLTMQYGTQPPIDFLLSEANRIVKTARFD